MPLFQALAAPWPCPRCPPTPSSLKTAVYKTLMSETDTRRSVGIDHRLILISGKPISHIGDSSLVTEMEMGARALELCIREPTGPRIERVCWCVYVYKPRVLEFCPACPVAAFPGLLRAHTPAPVSPRPRMPSLPACRGPGLRSVTTTETVADQMRPRGAVI